METISTIFLLDMMKLLDKEDLRKILDKEETFFFCTMQPTAVKAEF